MDYNSLVTQIKTYAYRNDAQFVNSIQYFIQNAHYHIYRDAKDIGEQATIADNFIENTPTINKPPDWNQTISLGYGTVDNATNASTFLLPRSFEFCRAYWPNASQSSSAPLFYADNNTEPYSLIWLAPTPNANYRYQLVYLTQPNVITAQITTNWLTKYAPDLLFYGCMIEAIPFLKDDERVPVWQAMYEKSLQSVNNYTKARYSDRIYKRDKD